MPRGKPVNEVIVQAIQLNYENADPKPSAPKIYGEMRASVEKTGHRMPSVRSIVAIIKKHRSLTDVQRLAFGEFHWPEGMAAAEVPWESGRAVLDFVGAWKRDTGRPPLIKLVKWYWRLSQSLPNTETTDREPLRRVLAAHFAYLELVEGDAAKKSRREIERKLIDPADPNVKWALPAGDPDSMRILRLMEGR